ncbi:MAG TPA: zinc-binding dehydrogenase [Pyrinomonadaceae bacterium]|nr:zinc-binding dehydrogenase [Pyrinomonadaceae bacterium]
MSADHERRQKALDYVFDGLEKGNLKVAIARDFPFEQYADAHRYLESNEQVGRVVVTV